MTEWRIVLGIETDDHGALMASKAAKEMLQQVFGDVSCVTLKRDQLQANLRVVPKFREPTGPAAPEHVGRIRQRRRNGRDA